MQNAQKHIFFVDDEPQIRKVVKRILESQGYRVTCFSNAVECLTLLQDQEIDCLATDVNMPDMNGLDLLKETKKIRPELPVLIITGYGDIDLAVKCMKAGAVDFIEKPLDKKVFLSLIKSILTKTDCIAPWVIEKLTKVELETLKLILSGKSSAGIAYLRHRSKRTIEDHRYKIMKKLGVNNTIELVKTALVIDEDN